MNQTNTKTALIIGASSGIGRELAKLLGADGYSLALAARRLSLLDTLQHELPSPALIKQFDVTDSEAAAKLIPQVVQQLGRLQLIVFCAGYGELNEALDLTLEQAAIDTNVTGFTAVTNTAIKYFIENRSGHFVAITSIAALRGSHVAPAYNAAKAYMANYLEGMRKKVTTMGVPVTITEIIPGFVDTAMAKGEGQFWVAPAHKAARQIYSAIGKKKTRVYITKRWRLIAWLLKLLPDFIYHRI